jgi:hypothetical protein
VRVRITAKPLEHEVDGVKLDGFEIGTIRDVSASLGSWLISAGYAELEMRQPLSHETGVVDRSKLNDLRSRAADRRRKS